MEHQCSINERSTYWQQKRVLNHSQQAPHNGHRITPTSNAWGTISIGPTWVIWCDELEIQICRHDDIFSYEAIYRKSAGIILIMNIIATKSRWQMMSSLGSNTHRVCDLAIRRSWALLLCGVLRCGQIAVLRNWFIKGLVVCKTVYGRVHL